MYQKVPTKLQKYLDRLIAELEAKQKGGPSIPLTASITAATSITLTETQVENLHDLDNHIVGTSILPDGDADVSQFSITPSNNLGPESPPDNPLSDARTSEELLDIINSSLVPDHVTSSTVVDVTSSANDIPVQDRRGEVFLLMYHFNTLELARADGRSCYHNAHGTL